jgi:hypothetical protein
VVRTRQATLGKRRTLCRPSELVAARSASSPMGSRFGQGRHSCAVQTRVSPIELRAASARGQRALVARFGRQFARKSRAATCRGELCCYAGVATAQPSVRCE